LAKKDDSAALREVERLLKSVLERQPNHLSAVFNLALLYADYLKRPSDAATLFQRFLDDAPSTHPARVEAERWLSAQTPALRGRPESVNTPVAPTPAKNR
jgi:cytochrome c-type biogenesis protein CcmH/NrfG